MTELLFEGFPKIARLNRDCVITEKIDGTNAQVIVDVLSERVLAASRTRLITPEDDNFGFARWVKENEAELFGLGDGRHFGEWWGQGIQRKYGQDRKRFSLFNVARWSETRPSCCDVVPVLYKGLFHSDEVAVCLEDLRANGSRAAPGFKDPEGIIVYHEAARQMFKITIKDDEKPKGSKE